MEQLFGFTSSGTFFLGLSEGTSFPPRRTERTPVPAVGVGGKALSWRLGRADKVLEGANLPLRPSRLAPTFTRDGGTPRMAGHLGLSGTALVLTHIGRAVHTVVLYIPGYIVLINSMEKGKALRRKRLQRVTFCGGTYGTYGVVKLYCTVW